MTQRNLIEPTFGSTEVAPQTLFVGDRVNIKLLIASGGDGDLTYMLDPAGGVLGLTYDETSRELHSGATGVTNGMQEFTWTATDGDGAAAVIAFTITAAPNSPPEIKNQALTAMVVGTSYAVSVTGSGSDDGNDPLTYTLTGLPDGLSFNAAGLQVVGTPTEAGEFTMTLTVTDSDGQSDTAEVTLTVTEPDA